jgi:hypothetical protein
MKKVAQMATVLIAALALFAGMATAQATQPAPGPRVGLAAAGLAQVEADMIFSLGGGVAISWATANIKKLLKNLHGAGTVAVTIALSYGLTAFVLALEGALRVPKLVLIGAVVAKMANGYYNQSHKNAPATPAS